MWADFEWENKVTVATNVTGLQVRDRVSTTTADRALIAVSDAASPVIILLPHFLCIYLFNSLLPPLYSLAFFPFRRPSWSTSRA